MKERGGAFSLLRGDMIKAWSGLKHVPLSTLLRSGSTPDFTFPLTEKLLCVLCSVFTPFKRYQGLLREKKHV